MNNKAFTLIELLVVVLIIGILAAVALPQYQKAVVKARLSTMLALGRALSNANETYYLANNEYTRDIHNLDIELPAECTQVATSGQYYYCGKYFLLDNNPGHLVIDYCPEHNASYADCQPKRDFSIMYVLEHANLEVESGMYCNIHHNSALGKQICEGLAGFTVRVASN